MHQPGNRPPPLVPDRVRRIEGGFAFIPNRFLLDGFFATLTADERSLYLLLILAGDREGVSFYRYDRLCSLLQVPLETYIDARNGLIAKDLLAFDGTRSQILSLPPRPTEKPTALLKTAEDFDRHDGATIRAHLRRALRDDQD